MAVGPALARPRTQSDSAPASPDRRQVHFTEADVVAGNAGPEDRQALIAAITTSWQRYLSQDTAGYTALLAPDVTRMSQRFGALQQGRDAVAAGMASEWESFERPDGIISETMTLQRAEFIVDTHGPIPTATALYHVDLTGGARWSYSDEGLVLQAFAKTGGAWTITHQTDAWSLDLESADQTSGHQTSETGGAFEFDYVYPVKNLERAVKFYTPILGAPEVVTADRAQFNLGGPRFILDRAGQGGFALVRKGLPNGYAVFDVKDVVAERNRLKKAGTRFIGGTETTPKTRGPDRSVLGLDVSGNLFMLTQKDFTTSSGAAFPPEVTGFPETDPHVASAKAIAAAWLRTDADALARHYGPDGRWFDDTRLKVRGLERGSAAIAPALRSVYWPRYDRTADGLVAALDAASVRTRTIGSRTIVSYAMALTGKGEHGFRETALVTHVFDSPDRAALTLVVASHRPSAMALALDYTGYPVEDLKQAERFYTKTMRLGRPYSDEDWRGYWSTNAVFGLFEADPEEDGVPVPERSNGYVSFWVRSARETHAYLKQHGATFPVIPAINSESGMDEEPGYTQVVATDSEGNIVVFTEYSGRRH